MSTEALILFEGNGGLERPDLWAELNRIRRGALSVTKALDAVVTAMKMSDMDAKSAAARHAQRALDAAGLEPLAGELLSVPWAQCEGQEHDPALWDVRTSLKEAQDVIGRLTAATPTRGALDALARGKPIADPVAALGSVEEAIAALRAVARTALRVTAGAEARDAMAGRSVGAPVPLAELFPELQHDAAEQKELARRLNVRCGDLCVDEQRAVLYKKSQSQWARMATYLAPIAWTLLGGCIVLLPFWLHVTGGLWTSWGGPLRAYALVLAGVAMHIVVSAQKERQAKSGAPLPLGSPLDWLHTRWAGVAWTFVSAVIVVFGVGLNGFTETTAADVAYLYLFAGFSVDSFAGLFLTRFDALAQKGGETLDEKISAGLVARQAQPR